MNCVVTRSYVNDESLKHNTRNMKINNTLMFIDINLSTYINVSQNNPKYDIKSNNPQ